MSADEKNDVPERRDGDQPVLPAPPEEARQTAADGETALNASAEDAGSAAAPAPPAAEPPIASPPEATLPPEAAADAASPAVPVSGAEHTPETGEQYAPAVPEHTTAAQEPAAPSTDAVPPVPAAPSVAGVAGVAAAAATPAAGAEAPTDAAFATAPTVPLGSYGAPDLASGYQSAPMPVGTPSAAPGASPLAAPAAPVATAAQSAAGAAFAEAFRSNNLITTLLCLAGVVGAALVTAVFLFIVVISSQQEMMSSSGASLDVGTAVGVLFLATMTLLAGGLTSGVSGDLSLFGGETNLGAMAGVSFVAIGVLALAGAAVFTVIRMREGRQSRALSTATLLRSGIDALLVAVVVAILAALARTGTVEGGAAISVQANAFGAFVSALVVTFLAAAAARAFGVQVRSAKVLTVAREFAWYVGGMHVVMLALSLVAAIVLAVKFEKLSILALWVPFGSNLASFLFGTLNLAPITAGQAPLGVSAYLWEIVGAWSILGFVVFLLTLAVLAVVIGVRRARTGRFEAGRVWQLPVAIFVGAFLMAVMVTPVRGYGEVPLFGSLDFGLTPSWETPLLVAVFAALVSVGAEVLPGYVYAYNPALLARIGGRQATTAWVQGVPAAPAAPVTLVPGTADAAPVVAGPAHTDAAPAAAAAAGATAGQPFVGASAPAGAAGAQPGLGVPAPLPAPKPLSAKAKRGLLATAIGVVGVGVMIAGAAIVISVLNANRDPALEARAYLEAIASGDTARAEAIVDPGLRTAERVLLTDEALGGQTQRIEVVEVATINKFADQAVIEATYRLDGETFEVGFSATAGPKEWLFLDTWNLDASPLVIPINVQVSEDVPDVTIGGVTIPTEDGSVTEPLYAYPGIYAVAIGGDSEWFAAEGTTQVRVVADEQAHITGEVVETDALRDAVLEQVVAQAEACVEIPTNMEDICPYAVQDDDLAALSLVSAPDGLDEFGDGRFRSSEGEVSTTSNPSLFNDSPEPRESTFTLRGTYEVKDGKVVVEFGDGWY